MYYHFSGNGTPFRRNSYRLHKKELWEVMKDKLVKRRERFDYENAIKYFKLDIFFNNFLLDQMKLNRKRKKPIYSQYKLYKMFFNLPINRSIQLENTVFDKWYLANNGIEVE